MPTRRHFLRSGVAACTSLAGLPISKLFAVEAATSTTVAGPGYGLRFIGSMRKTIMMGKRNALLDLKSLKGTPHLYGIGPIEGLTGEVTIADGRMALARIGADRAVHVTENYDAAVPFFVWAEVPQWQTVALAGSISTYAALEDFIGVAGQKAAFAAAFPFVVTGRAKHIGYHVVDAKPETPSGMASHQTIQIPFALDRVEVTLVGFWSKSHQGIFTPMGSNMHVHVQTADNSSSGHVETLDLTQYEMTLGLPKGS
jgi:acetolactate decarboxylase